MTIAEPACDSEDTLERDVDAAIALCDGDVRAALRAALLYNTFLERKLELMRGQISSGFARGRLRKPPARAGTDPPCAQASSC